MLLMVLGLVSCGQPMQIGAPSPVQVQPTRLPNSALPSLPANSVPSATSNDHGTADFVVTPFATATITPTVTVELATPAKQLAATPKPAVMVVPITREPETNEQRWRAQQKDRQVNDPPHIYVAPNSATLWWYDPLINQSVPIGTISGEFPVQAEFILRGAQQPALEVPYRINNDFGLTAISEAVRERMQAAGYSQSVEAYVLRTADIHPK
jgi:hypothetical protein